MLENLILYCILNQHNNHQYYSKIANIPIYLSYHMILFDICFAILGKDDGFREWRDNLKNVLKKTSLTVNQNVLFLYDTQMMADDRYVEVNIIFIDFNHI